MDSNNWRAAQGQMAQGQGGAGGASAMPNAVAATAMDNVDWRTQLQSESRDKLVNKIMDTLKRHLPFSGQEGQQELKKIAVRFEEKIYTAATSQHDYMRKISLKMLTMETKSQNPMANSNTSKNPPDPVGHSLQSQILNQPLSVPVVGNQSQANQQLLPQNMLNSISSAGVQSSASLTSTLPAVGNLTQASMPNVLGKNNLQNMQNFSNVAQNPVGNSMGQGMPPNVFTNSQRQIPGRQQVGPQQQQQQSANSHLLYQQQQQQQQLQQQYMKQKFQQPGSIPQSVMQSHMQQHQQNLLQPGQVQTSQQAVMQPTVTQSASLSNLQQNQQSSTQQGIQPVLQAHSQSVMRQQQQQQQQPQQGSILHQPQTSMPQQQMLPTAQQGQQQLQVIGQQPNATNIQHNQLIGQPNCIPDLQQQQQRLLGQQNNIPNLQQQQLMGQQNNLSNMHQTQLGPQNNVSGLQQSQMLGTQSGNSGIPVNQHSVHMLQKLPVQQQMQHANLLPNQAQQSQTQPTQQQMMSQLQSQNGQLQHLPQQSNPMPRDMQQRLQTSGPLLQRQNVVEQQKQLFQAQRVIPEASSTSLDSTAQTGNASGGDWQEEVYQKVKSMKDKYYIELKELYMKMATKLQNVHESLPQQTKNEQFEKFKLFKGMLERLVQLLQMNKSEVQLGHKEKLASVEKQIIQILNSNRPRKSVPSQQGQHAQPHMQQSQPQAQISQMHPRENQMNAQMQSMNIPSSVATMQQNNMSVLQHNSLSSVSDFSNSQQSMINAIQPASNPDGGQSNALNSLQQVAMSSLQQNPVSSPQPMNISSLTSQSGMNTQQSNLNSLQTNSAMLQNQHLKQQEQQMLQTQQLKQKFQQGQMMFQRQQQQQLMQQQQHQQQQQQQQTKQQQPAQLPGHHMSPLQQMTDSTDMKMRQQMGVKSGVIPQHHSTGQRAAYHHQQLKPGSPFSISSPQILHSASPQVPQHPSPQIDQQSLLSSMTKTGTPLQSANSPFVAPSPPTPLAPSPMPGESEKLNSSISSLSNAGNIGGPQTTAVSGPAQSLAIGTPGISASPLLAEFTNLDAAHGTVSSVISSKSNAVEQPFERLIKAVKSASHEALTASVSDISSVVSMVDRIAGSAPGNGSRAAVGEDLVAMTKCRLQARNFFTQDGPTGTKKMRRSTSAMPSNIVSSAGSISEGAWLLNGSDTSEMESTATSSIKRPRIETSHALFEEIHEINRRLIDTVVGICDKDVDPTAVAAAAEGGDGTIVKCTFSAVALSPNLKSQYASAQMSPIQPLRLLVPTYYPNCSPVLLDKFPVEVSKEYEDLSIKAKSRFSISLRSLSHPMSLEEMAKTWDMCARAVISEYAQQSGGGTFSSKYGTWENCASASS